MAGVILETLSNKQLVIFTLVLLAVQIMFFITGGTLGKLKSIIPQLEYVLDFGFPNFVF